MPANRLTALLRSIAEYRVEACFLAALVFTLGHNAYHDAPVELHMTTSHETVVHEVVPVRVAEARRASHAGHPGIVGVAVPARAPRAAVAGSGIDRRIVIERGSVTRTPCAGSPALAAAAVGEGGTCKVIRVAPVAPGVTVSRSFANGG